MMRNRREGDVKAGTHEKHTSITGDTGTQEKHRNIGYSRKIKIFILNLNKVNV